MGRAVPGVGRSCLGCLGSVIIVPLFAYILAAPVSFHLGGHWTPIARWTGVGRLRDSAGVSYGLYVRFTAVPTLDVRNEATTCCELTGEAQVCTRSGTKYQFSVSGAMSKAWLRTDGAEVTLNFGERGHPKLPRVFQLSGVWRGPSLVLDDQKSMFIHFLPGGNLTPSPTYSSPVPERHARVTVSWGDLSDFESLCASIRNAR